MHDQLVECDESSDLTWQLDPAGEGRALPRRGVSPRLGQRLEITRDPVLPGRFEIGGARSWRRATATGFLAGDRGEPPGQRADVVDEVAETSLRTRRG